jgi:ATP-binding cassette subfamily F protein 3
LLTLSNVRVRRGAHVLLDEVTVSVFRGEKIGVVGRNGSGKSTLLALLRGAYPTDAGDYQAPRGLAVAAVEQELPESGRALIDYILDGDFELRATEAELGQAQAQGDGTREALLHARLEAQGAYGAQARAARLADGLGFANADLARPVREFSGGLRRRANLARALMRRSDLLLLDEPTNHLDLDALLWLEAWLREYPGTLLLVSHDREFLDGVASRVFSLGGGRLRAYTGNYSAFEVQHAAEVARSSALATKRRAQDAHIEAFVARFRAKASKARQVQSRLKWLARLPEIAAAHEEGDFEFEFAAPASLPRPLVTLERVSAGYPGRRVLERVSLTLHPGERLGVLGRNGAGKSTLMRVLAGTLEVASGELTRAADLAPGLLAQSELEQLDPASSALRELVQRGGAAVGAWGAQAQRDFLGRFGFAGERVFEPCAHFSGGERTRLALAILVARRPNLLLLDEPTNHLDLAMRHSLLVALQEFPGAVVLVSHDRALLRGVCDRFVLIEDGALSGFDGDLEDYAAHLAAHRTQSARGAAPETPSRREERRLAAEARAKASPLRGEQRRLEERLAVLARERLTLEGTLADPATYSPGERDEPQALARRHGELTAEIRVLEERWLEVMTALEGHAP